MRFVMEAIFAYRRVKWLSLNHRGSGSVRIVDFGAPRGRFALISPVCFVVWFGLLLAFRAFLVALPNMDGFEKSYLGNLVGLCFLVVQPFVCRFVAHWMGATRYIVREVYIRGFISSGLLFFPMLLMFME